jgi:hypothetical protein
MPDPDTLVRINLYKKKPKPSRAEVLLALYERDLEERRSVVKWADWHDAYAGGPSEHIVEQTLTFAQCIKVANAPPIMIVEEGHVHYTNPDSWSEDEERVMIVNGYPYRRAGAEAQRVVLLRRSAKRLSEASRKKKRLKLLKQYTRRIKNG